MRPLRLAPVMALLILAGCGMFGHFDTAPALPESIPPGCEDQVYADPKVKDLLMKGAGSENYRISHIEQLKFAKLDALHHCMQQKGLAPAGGGVQRPNVSD